MGRWTGRSKLGVLEEPKEQREQSGEAQEAPFQPQGPVPGSVGLW